MVTYRPIDWFDWLPKDLYRVGDDGSVWRWYAGTTGSKSKKYPPHWRKLKPTKHKRVATHYVSLSGLTLQKQCSLGAIVCRAFHGPRPIGCQAIQVGNDPKSFAAKDVRWAPKGCTSQGGGNSNFSTPGEGHPASRLTEAEVLEIRRMAAAGECLQDIADVFGVTRGNIGHIVRGRNWRHLPGANPDYRPTPLRGEDVATSELNADDVRKIRRMAKRGISGPRIAGRFGIHKNTVAAIIKGSSWKHVEGAVPEWGGVIRGSRIGGSRLKEADIPVIRSLAQDGWKGSDIARRFGVSESTVSLILRGKRWAHVPKPTDHLPSST